MIAPAPRNPIPVTIWAAIRLGSARTTLSPEARKAWNPYAETTVKSAEPSDTSRCVRRPASRPRRSRSIPIAAPNAAASESRSAASPQWSDGTLDASNVHRLELLLRDQPDAAVGEVEQLVERVAAERILLGRSLHLDQPAVARH